MSNIRNHIIPLISALIVLFTTGTLLSSWHYHPPAPDTPNAVFSQSPLHASDYCIVSHASLDVQPIFFMTAVFRRAMEPLYAPSPHSTLSRPQFDTARLRAPPITG